MSITIHNQRVRIWDYALSYFFDRQLALAHSSFNPYLEVVLSSGRVQLNTNKVTYSHEDLYHTFFYAFQKKAVQRRAFKKVLILGMGLGSIQTMLCQKFGQKAAKYTAVEIDGIIIDLATMYMNPTALKKTDIYCTDAYDFVLEKSNNGNEKYDLIAVDIFLDAETPNKFRGKFFLSYLDELLAENGLLFYNTLLVEPHLKRQSEHFYEHIFTKVFSQKHCEAIENKGNKMLIYNKL